MDPNTVPPVPQQPVQQPTDPSPLVPPTQPVTDQSAYTTPTPPPAPEPVTTPLPDAPVLPTEPTPQPADAPTVDAQSAAPTNDQPQAAQDAANYIEDVGGSVLDLLDDINEDETLQQTVANEMRLDAPKVKEILSGLLSKIDQGQVTTDELALLMTAPIVDETPEAK